VDLTLSSQENRQAVSEITLENSYKPITNTAWVRKLEKRVHSTHSRK
jgi:hypothetical protein